MVGPSIILTVVIITILPSFMATSYGYSGERVAVRGGWVRVHSSCFIYASRVCGLEKVVCVLGVYELT